MKQEKLINYLKWLETEQEFNYHERVRYFGENHPSTITNKECARVAKMIRELIEEGRFN